MQVQLDNLFDLLQRKNNGINTMDDENSNKHTQINQEIAQKNVAFPIRSIEELDIFENELADPVLEKKMVCILIIKII